MSGKCKNCGSTEIETDPARGDAVCTACGVVLEDQRIVSETAFEETPSGNMTMIGQFVASDSTGGATGFGAAYHVNGKESRDITIQNARKGITHLCQQLRLNQRHIETSVNFYKMALSRNLTRGRKHAHNHAACVYITCRTEETPHLLIDISDILQIDVHELGRTYLKFTNALCINIPSMDPCLFIMKYALKLEFGDKTNEVSNTAQRLLQRMMRDSIHSGRRPSGLCGAALLIASRLHEFNRTPNDIIKIVKVHESTLRKRLIEFGDTPSSALTLDEFMTVDLEEEQDPPAFKAARKKDRERLQKLENIDTEFDDLQSEIDRQLEEYRTSKGKRRRNNDEGVEEIDAERFVAESTMDVIKNCLNSNAEDSSIDNFDNDRGTSSETIGLGPDIASMGLGLSMNESHLNDRNEDDLFETENGEIDMTDVDDEELDSYIMTEKEASMKSNLWHKVNATYLEQQKEKEEKRLKEKEEGKPEKKKRKTGTKKKSGMGPANSAGEAIEKMLQEKRISTKINYEVLKSLNIGVSSNQGTVNETTDETDVNDIDGIRVQKEVKVKLTTVKQGIRRGGNKHEESLEDTSPGKKGNIDNGISESIIGEGVVEIVDEADDYVEDEVEIDPNEISVGQMLQRHTDEEEQYGYDYDDEEY
ncbi:transcription factor IIIB 90 kDa subunit [Diachasma alloeum]|uniref:transcription factor IIIB 90 kDa subunit n=1 Tax=Diachasma alloeum TaxID=454923 RepID=UPI000738103C|nr:transcription factor IIIB 90 kDa subunit [Diachasma alloeum]